MSSKIGILFNCPKLSQFSQGNLPLNLQSLIISNCNNLTPQKERGLHGTVSLTCFEIKGGCSNVKSFPEEGLLPNALTSLQISSLPNLEASTKAFGTSRRLKHWRSMTVRSSS